MLSPSESIPLGMMVSLRLPARAAFLGLGLMQLVPPLAWASDHQRAHQVALAPDEGLPPAATNERDAALGRHAARNLSRADGIILAQVGSGDHLSCSSAKPCEFGCCGQPDDEGQARCGSGPRYCGERCISQCDWKSECDPGWGSRYSSMSACPLNVCCSRYGFCGVTEEFCGSDRVVPPSCPGGRSATKRTIGYYQGWNLERPCGSMTPEDIPLGQYTHINFAFAYVAPVTFHVAHMNAKAASLYERVLQLKARHPKLQVWIAIAGGSMSPWQSAFSEMASTEANQDAFLHSLMTFLEENHFDGVDLNWEYPVARGTGGRPEDFDTFVVLCRRLRERLEDSGLRYGLSMTLPTAFAYMKGYNIKRLQRHIDWFNFMTYDFHGIWDGNADEGGKAFPHTNLTELQMKLDILWRNGIDPGHVVMGLGFYGRSFTLRNPDCKAPGCPFSAVGKAGDCTATPGMLSAREIRKLIEGGAVVTFDKKAAVKVVTWDNDQWVSYDDAQTLKMRMEYANSMCLGGTMVWAVDYDDLDGTLVKALDCPAE